jgi:hypothetical protein
MDRGTNRAQICCRSDSAEKPSPCPPGICVFKLITQGFVMTQTLNGTMKVEIKNAKAISGLGTLSRDTSGQIWFDFSGKPYPSSLDWKKATTLTFTPNMGKERTYYKADTEFFFNGGWVGPRLVLQKATRQAL